jgi:UDP-2,3-diacylglucosamine pyrophosphatase LpxH
MCSMLVVISDLHFREESSDHVGGNNQYPPIVCWRNLPVLPYRRFIAVLAAEAVRNGTQRLDLALAGDIFDIHRTALWFGGQEQIRPYVKASAVSAPLEGRVLEILEAIASEDNVSETLAAFRLLANGRYWDNGERDFPVPVRLHYVPGNHDRLANATPAIRRRLRALLGMPESGAPFPWVLALARERAVVRHGHQYDLYNFGADLRQTAEIPLYLPEEHHEAATFGDFVTVDIASRLPFLFRQYHGDEALLSTPLLRTVYLRLLEFDDLRPQSAMLRFLLHMPEEGLTPQVVWRVIEPVLRQLLEAIHDDPYLHEWLRRLSSRAMIDAFDVVRLLLRRRLWRHTRSIPLWLVERFSQAALRRNAQAPAIEHLAVRERAILSGDYLFLVAGHTHAPRVSLLTADPLGERYYVDTGTWRNQIPAAPDFTSFGRLKSLTYAILYGPEEDLGRPPKAGKIASLDYWSGVTRRWLDELS